MDLDVDKILVRCPWVVKNSFAPSFQGDISILALGIAKKTSGWKKKVVGTINCILQHNEIQPRKMSTFFVLGLLKEDRNNARELILGIRLECYNSFIELSGHTGKITERFQLSLTALFAYPCSPLSERFKY